MQLATYLKRRRLTASAFAEIIGVHKSTPGRWMKGRRFPRPVELEAVRAATDGAVKAQDFVNTYQIASPHPRVG